MKPEEKIFLNQLRSCAIDFCLKLKTVRYRSLAYVQLYISFAYCTFCERSDCLSVSLKQLKFKMKRQSKHLQLNSKGPIPLPLPTESPGFPCILKYGLLAVFAIEDRHTHENICRFELVKAGRHYCGYNLIPISKYLLSSLHCDIWKTSCRYKFVSVFIILFD